MNPILQDRTIAAMAPAYAEESLQKQERTRNLLYQAGTILAILLFLISV